MGILQDTYVEKQPIGFPGMPANSEPADDLTRTSETTANGGIAFGVPAAQGAADLGVIAAAAAGDKLLGITLRDISLAPSKGDRYTKGSNTTVRNRGSVWVTVGAPVAPRDPVLFDTATQKYTSVASGTTLDLGALGWRFDLTAAANGLSIAVRR